MTNCRLQRQLNLLLQHHLQAQLMESAALDIRPHHHEEESPSAACNISSVSTTAPAGLPSLPAVSSTGPSSQQSVAQTCPRERQPLGAEPSPGRSFVAGIRPEMAEEMAQELRHSSQEEQLRQEVIQDHHLAHLFNCMLNARPN